MSSQKIGFLGSCQLGLCCDFFLNKQIQEKYNINIKFALYFFDYDQSYTSYKGKLDYTIFDDLDILVIEQNSLDNQSSSEKIIDYIKNRNKKVKIIRTFLLKMPIYPINWSGYGENEKDYLQWNGLENIDYKEKFKKCIESMRKQNNKSDLSSELTDFVENNFNKQLLFTHSLHPTNILLYQLWKYILWNLSINIEDNQYKFTTELINHWKNPFTSKMVKDLDIKIKDIEIDDQFYINRYKENKNKFGITI